MDASLGNRDGLLFHSLVDSHLILNIHLIKLINAADAMISKHQSSCFDAELSCLGVFQDTGSQTSSARSFTTGIDRSGEERADVLQELTLGRAWVTNDANVDITSQLDALNCGLVDSSEQLQKDTFLDIKMSKH